MHRSMSILTVMYFMFQENDSTHLSLEDLPADSRSDTEIRTFILAHFPKTSEVW